MATAHEIAFALLPAFAENVIARLPPHTYGHYAHVIGRNPAKDAQSVGQAMHAIGAMCIIREVPVAPLFWVKREDGEYRGIFEADPTERQIIIDGGHYETMYALAREHRYSEDEFTGIGRALQWVSEHPDKRFLSAHQLWHHTFTMRVDGTTETHFQRAMRRYNEMLEELKRQRPRAR